MAQLIGNLLLDLGLLVLVVVPPIFIANQVYKDGALGRISLAAISGSALLLLCEHRFFGNSADTMLMLFTALVLACAAFLCWHLWRFHSRVLREHEDHTVVVPASAKTAPLFLLRR